MKTLTLSLAAKEINRVAQARLTGPMDGDAKTRIAQFTQSVEAAIIQLQQQVQELQQQLAHLKK